MLRHLLPESNLIHAALPRQLTRRNRAHIHVVVVEVAYLPVLIIRARRRLLVDIRNILLPERAVMKPVIAAPSIHHRIHRHRNLQRRMRMHQRHQRQISVIRNPQHADLPIRLRHMLHQPVNRVICIRRLIHRRGIQRPVQRPVHHIIALAAILAANILHHADIPALNDRLRRIVVAPQAYAHVNAVRIGRQPARIIRRPRQQHPRMLRALRNKDDRAQLHPVAHRHHHLAALVIHARSRWHKLGRSLTRIIGILWRLRPQTLHRKSHSDYRDRRNPEPNHIVSPQRTTPQRNKTQPTTRLMTSSIPRLGNPESANEPKLFVNSMESLLRVSRDLNVAG